MRRRLVCPADAPQCVSEQTSLIFRTSNITCNVFMLRNIFCSQCMKVTPLSYLVAMVDGTYAGLPHALEHIGITGSDGEQGQQING